MVAKFFDSKGRCIRVLPNVKQESQYPSALDVDGLSCRFRGVIDGVLTYKAEGGAS